MAIPGYVASTLLMGALFVVVVALVFRGATHPSTAHGSGDGAATDAHDQSTPRLPGETVARRVHGRLGTYAAGYVLLVAVVGGGSVLFLLGYDVGLVMLGVVFVLLAGYVFLGVYWLSRSRGRSTARATAEGVTTLVVLLLAAVVVKLLVAG